MTTAALSVLIAGIAVGRTVGASLTRRFAVAPLIYVSLALAGAGFLIVWVSPWLAAGIGGLFVTGLGFALLFPSPPAWRSPAGGQTDRAMAIIAVVIGATMGAAPFLLGAVAGTVGVTAGFVIVPVLLLVGAAAVRVATRIGRDSATPIATRLPAVTVLPAGRVTMVARKVGEVVGGLDRFPTKVVVAVVGAIVPAGLAFTTPFGSDSGRALRPPLRMPPPPATARQSPRRSRGVSRHRRAVHPDPQPVCRTEAGANRGRQRGRRV